MPEDTAGLRRAALIRNNHPVGSITTPDNYMRHLTEKSAAFAHIFFILFSRGEKSCFMGTPKATLKSFEQDLLEQDWTQVEDGIEVKLRSGPDGNETFILCRSLARHEK